MTYGFAAGTLNSWLGVLGNGASAGTTYTGLAANYAQLHTGDPGAAGTANVSAGSTTRVACGLAAASGGSRSLTGTNPSWTNGGTSETIAGVSLWTATSAGTFVLSAQLSASKTWASSDTLTLSSLTISITPVAA